ncbi:MAG: hypothetical protein AMXMBFR45_25680 [Gammaproteobacteria bacterium]|nr:MAG: hypothetical protein EDM71_07875 [Pseudomonadota bacterium]MBC6945121.1 hypothetical protein [Gammaproteobacteria bacterium]MCL4778066.1 hemerythrin domain-containing protein [Gammaproteobacteria bacterium]MCQ3934708.1 hypothetical protein [Gammaproteobacteria bacterium]MDL1880731.1 hypothetical protein [Gammaproteobacteria bacterium PRO2]
MIKLSARTRVSELMAGPPALYTTLKSTGLFRDGDDPEVMLGQLCWAFGFNPAILLMMLEGANVPEVVAPIDAAPFRAMPLGELVDHIESTHHAYLRAELPRLTASVDTLALEAGETESAIELRDEMRRMASELDAHIQHEEESLFAMVRDLAARSAIKPTRCGGTVGGPIACMENEHGATLRGLAKLRELTDSYSVTADASASRRETMAALERFDRDMQEHIFKENEVLFPRAMEAQRGQPQAASA